MVFLLGGLVYILNALVKKGLIKRPNVVLGDTFEKQYINYHVTFYEWGSLSRSSEFGNHLGVYCIITVKKRDYFVNNHEHMTWIFAKLDKVLSLDDRN